MRIIADYLAINLFLIQKTVNFGEIVLTANGHNVE
jgi:hypothetical protein